MKFADKLAQLRYDQKLSQEQVAEKLSVSRQSVAKWESGQSWPDIPNLIALSQLLGKSIDFLLKDDDSACHPTLQATPPSYQSVIAFLLRAKKQTYAGKGAEIEPFRPKAHDLCYREEDYLYWDSYLGGEKFAGEEALWYQNTPFWAMNYWGKVTHPTFSGDFLKQALLAVPEELPFRGPPIYKAGDYTYHCLVSGDFEAFHGREEIYWKETLVYYALFHGGSVE